MLTTVGPFVPDLGWILAQFSPPAEQATGATLAVPSWSWISKGNLHMKALIKAPGSPLFPLLPRWRSWKALRLIFMPQLLEKHPHVSLPPMCLTWTRAEEVAAGGRSDFLPSFTPAKRLTGFGLSAASTVETASTSPPSTGHPHAESWLCTSQPLTYLQAYLTWGKGDVIHEAKEMYYMRQRRCVTWVCLFSISRELLSAMVERNKDWKCPNLYDFLQNNIKNMFLVIPQDSL